MSAPFERQPREHAVVCTRCVSTRTWNLSAICDRCTSLAARAGRGLVLAVSR